MHDGLRAELRALQQAAAAGRLPGKGAARLAGELDGLAAIMESHFAFEERRILRALDELRTDVPATASFGTAPAS